MTTPDSAVRPCSRCGEPIQQGSRADRRTCSTSCRVALWRAGNARGRPDPVRGGTDTAPVAIDRPASLHALCAQTQGEIGGVVR
jgi:hypothetical protein